MNTTDIYCFKHFVMMQPVCLLCCFMQRWRRPLRPDPLCPVRVFVSRRRKPEHGQRHQQPGAVAHSLPEEAGARRRAVPDGSAAPGDPRGRPPPAHYADEVCRGLRLQGGVRGRSARLHPTPPPPTIEVANTNEAW